MPLDVRLVEDMVVEGIEMLEVYWDMPCVEDPAVDCGPVEAGVCVEALLEVTGKVACDAGTVSVDADADEVSIPVLVSVDDVAVVDGLCCAVVKIDELGTEDDSVVENVLAADVDVVDGKVVCEGKLDDSRETVDTSPEDVLAELVDDPEGNAVCSMLVSTETDVVVGTLG